MKINKSIAAGSLLIGVGLSVAAAYAVTPKVKNLASKMSNNNDSYNNSTR